jgi:hypothetical protein
MIVHTPLMTITCHSTIRSIVVRLQCRLIATQLRVAMATPPKHSAPNNLHRQSIHYGPNGGQLRSFNLTYCRTDRWRVSYHSLYRKSRYNVRV